ncbi:MAG: hypothetical protein WBN16_11475 [Lutimonas sp.]
MSKKEVIIACAGHMNAKSIAKLTNTSLQYVYNLLSQCEIKKEYKYPEKK